jgi:hypothetical protein
MAARRKTESFAAEIVGLSFISSPHEETLGDMALGGAFANNRHSITIKSNTHERIDLVIMPGIKFITLKFRRAADETGAMNDERDNVAKIEIETSKLRKLVEMKDQDEATDRFDKILKKGGVRFNPDDEGSRKLLIVLKSRIARLGSTAPN